MYAKFYHTGHAERALYGDPLRPKVATSAITTTMAPANQSATSAKQDRALRLALTLRGEICPNLKNKEMEEIGMTRMGSMQVGNAKKGKCTRKPEQMIVTEIVDDVELADGKFSQDTQTQLYEVATLNFLDNPFRHRPNARRNWVVSTSLSYGMVTEDVTLPSSSPWGGPSPLCQKEVDGSFRNVHRPLPKFKSTDNRSEIQISPLRVREQDVAKTAFRTRFIEDFRRLPIKTKLTQKESSSTGRKGRERLPLIKQKLCSAPTLALYTEGSEDFVYTVSVTQRLKVRSKPETPEYIVNRRRSRYDPKVKSDKPKERLNRVPMGQLLLTQQDLGHLCYGDLRSVIKHESHKSKNPESIPGPKDVPRCEEKILVAKQEG
ncbi:hypothetical protein Tco_1319409 [Tanacetum coccineum]